MYYPNGSPGEALPEIYKQFKGYYSDSVDLPASATAGDFAIVGSTDTMWIYDGDTSTWKDSGIGSGVLSFNGRLGAVLPATNDYTWAQINKTVSSLADLTTRNYSDLQGIPSSFTPSAHVHAGADITSGNLDIARMPTGGGTWALGGNTILSGGDVIFNQRIQCFTSYSNQFEMKNTSATGLGTFLIENNIGIARALKILNSGASYAGTGFLNDFAGNAITEPNATCIANAYNAPMYLGVNDKAIACLYDGKIGLGVFNATDKPATLLDMQPIRDGGTVDTFVIGDTRVGNTSDAFKVMSQGDGGRVFIYSYASARFDLRAGGNSSLSPNGYMTLDPTNGLRVEADSIFNYAYEDRDFSIRKLTSGTAYNYDAGLDQHTWNGASTYLGFTGGTGVFGVSNYAGTQYLQLGNQNVVINDGVNTLSSGLSVQTLSFANATTNLWNTLSGNIFYINNLAQDIDIELKKLTSGTAYKYDAGNDRHWFGATTLYAGAPNASFNFVNGSMNLEDITSDNMYFRMRGGSGGTKYKGGIAINGNAVRIGTGDYPDSIQIAGASTQRFLNLENGTITFNPSNLDQDFIINKLTSGVAYQYDAGNDAHLWGDTSVTIAGEDYKFYHASDNNFYVQTDGSNNSRVIVKNNDSNWAMGIGSGGGWSLSKIGSFGNVISVDSAVAGNNQVFHISSGNTIFNDSNLDWDFTVEKLTSGIAYVYDAGNDYHTWNTARVAETDKYLFGIPNGGAMRIKAPSGNASLEIETGGTIAQINLSNSSGSARGTIRANATALELMRASVLYIQCATTGTVFNPNNNDQDFTIKKNSSGDALVFDAGALSNDGQFNITSYIETNKDLKITDSSKGLLMVDRTTSTVYRLYMDDGIIGQEVVA